MVNCGHKCLRGRRRPLRWPSIALERRETPFVRQVPRDEEAADRALIPHCRRRQPLWSATKSWRAFDRGGWERSQEEESLPTMDRELGGPTGRWRGQFTSPIDGRAAGSDPVGEARSRMAIQARHAPAPDETDAEAQGTGVNIGPAATDLNRCQPVNLISARLGPDSVDFDGMWPDVGKRQPAFRKLAQPSHRNNV